VTDAELRALVRDSVARHLGRGTPPQPHLPETQTHDRGPAGAAAPWRQHASHHLYISLANVDDACVIEPAVACDHCGYCKSHGH
jgi:hypothetical protein